MYKKITLLFILVLVVLVSFGSVNTWAWNDKRTHKDLSEKAAAHSVLSLTSGNYLKSLGFSKNIEEPFILNGKSKSVKEWIGEGGIKEDAGNIFTAYYYNHFHNPLRIWSQAGLTTIYPSINGMSSLIWAQDTSTPNPWRWQKAREYYYIALTGKDFSGLEVASSKEKRDEYFAQTFKGLGHIIHLIEDAAQPAHVRDDPHPLDDIGIVPQFENWAYYNAEVLGFYDLPPVFPTVSLNTSAEPGYIPITQFWDTDQFTDTNPVGGNAIGLAEYTGANFFSEDTIFSTSYPSWSNVVEYDKTIDDNTGEQRTYIRKLGAGEIISDKVGYGDPIQHLATTRWFYRYLPSEYKRFGLKLDDNVYLDYASLLLPRAVGYSAGLINYFFRGQIGIRITQDGITVKNTNTETMDSYTDSATGQTIGNISIYYDDTNSLRRLLASYDISAPFGLGQEVFIPFTAPSDNIKQNRYIIVFRGKLGNEEGAVIGKVISGYIYYVSDQNGWRQIFRMDADNGANPMLIYNNSSNLHIGRISVSPDGKNLAFAAGLSPVESNIYLIDLTAGPAAQETLLTRGDAPAWSPDGSKIAFERESGAYLPSQSDVELYAIETTTKIETPLTNVSGPSYSAHPSWSPDGTLIAYSRFNSNPQEPDCYNSYVIALINISGQPQGAVSCSLEASYADWYPAWSPDGNEIAFIRKTPNNIYQLYKVNRSTNTSTKLADSSGTGKDNLAPVWSPDGTRIAIGAMYGGNADIWLVNSTGGYLTNLTGANSGIDEFPAYGH